MKKLLLILCLFSMTAHAEWTYIISNSEKSAHNSVDFSTLKIDGDVRTFWELIDYNKPQYIKSMNGVPYKAIKVRKSINCREQTVKALEILTYAESFGKGKMLTNEDIESFSKFKSIVPDSLESIIHKAICSFNS